MKKFLIAVATGLLVFGGQVGTEASSIENLNEQNIEIQETGKWSHLKDKYVRDRDNRDTDEERRNKERRAWMRRELRRRNDDHHRYEPPPPPPQEFYRQNPPRYVLPSSAVVGQGITILETTTH